MEFGEVLLRDSSLKAMGGLCRCCLAAGCSKELTAEYISDGGKEIYADILLECYDICLAQRTESVGVLEQYICEACIVRLREAVSFKRQVVETEARYLDMLGQGLLLPKVEVSELDLKMEAEVPSDDETGQYNQLDYEEDSDDAPLRPRTAKTTKRESSTVAVRGRGKKAKRTKTDKDEAKRAPPTRSRRSNLRTLLNNTSAVPFKWRGKYMCFYCGCDMPGYTDLVKHTRSHGPCDDRDFAIKSVRTANCEVKVDVSNLTCEHCDEEFSGVKDAIKHLVCKHNIEYDRNVEMCLSEYRLVDLSCLVCGSAFKFFKHLVQHVNNSHPKNTLVCEVCSQRFNKKADLLAHTRNYHHKAGYKCVECQIEFSSGTKLRAHRERHLQTCNVCFERFSSTAKKMRHINRVHLSEGCLQCGFCHKTCSTKHSFLQHSSLCKEKKKLNEKYPDSIITVDDAEDKKPTVKELRSNLACLFNMSTALPFKYVMNRFRCYYCPNDFVDPDLLREHTILEHPVCDTAHKSMKLRARDFADIKIDISALNCKVCFQELNTLEVMIDHLILEHKAVYNKSVECRIMAFRIVKDNYLCPLCPQSEVYRFFGNLLKHMNDEHTNNKLICMYCGKPFRAAPNLRHHIARHHKEASHKCTECNQLYTTLVLLNSHMAKAHGKEIAKCPMCPERFVSTYLRQKHLISAHNSGSACPHCGRLFTRNSLMRIHIRRTHLKEKKVGCPVCHTKFFDNFMMKKHLATHGGDRNFNCDVCGKKFLWKTNLRNHLATHNKHRVGDVELADDGDIKKLVPTKRRRRNLIILFNNTTVIPFKWRGKYLCFYCGKDITDHTDLRKHTRSHGLCDIKDFGIQAVRTAEFEIKLDVSEMTCEMCHEAFATLDEIIMHLMCKHKLAYDRDIDLHMTEYRLVDLTCLVCGETFGFFKHLVQHTNSCHPRDVLVCEVCSQRFSKKRDLEAHTRNYHSKEGYKCDECEIEFASRTKLRAHKESQHLQTCNVCFEKFRSSALKMKHINSVHLNKETLRCGFCRKVWKTKHAFLQHSNKCRDMRKARLIDDENPHKTEVDDTETKSTVKVLRTNLACIFNMSTAVPFKFFMNRFRCFYCPKDFIEHEDLKLHSITDHPVCDIKHRSMRLRARDQVDIKIDISTLKCKVCYQTIPDLTTLIDHLTIEHQADYNKTVNCRILTFNLVKDSYVCPLCPNSEVYRFFINLLKHMNDIHSNNRLICVFCGKAFRTDPNLRSHISRHHKAATFKCTECESTFHTGVRLNTHMAKAHGKKVAQCPKCPERFVSTYLRQKHLITVHNFGATCPHCGRMFTRNSLMRDHIRRTHLKEKKVECPVCQMRFFDAFMLRMHMVRHDGERNFQCDLCGKKFLWKKNLRNHMTTHEKHAMTHITDLHSM